MQENATTDALLKQDSSSLAAEITDLVQKNLPREKAIASAQMLQTQEDVKNGLGPTSGDGRGQAIASIPPILYLRWQLEYPGCWKDKGFMEEFLFDNPQCCLPGYKPRPKRMFFNMRHNNLKIANPGGDLYHERKARVMQAVSNQFTETAKNG